MKNLKKCLKGIYSKVNKNVNLQNFTLWEILADDISNRIFKTLEDIILSNRNNFNKIVNEENLQREKWPLKQH